MVSFDVVTCGFSSAPLPWLDRPGDVRLPDPCAPDFLDLAFSALDGLEVDRRVLLVHPAGRTSAHRLGVLRASLRNPFVVPVGLPLSSRHFHSSHAQPDPAEPEPGLAAAGGAQRLGGGEEGSAEEHAVLDQELAHHG